MFSVKLFSALILLKFNFQIYILILTSYQVYEYRVQTYLQLIHYKTN